MINKRVHVQLGCPDTVPTACHWYYSTGSLTIKPRLYLYFYSMKIPASRFAELDIALLVLRIFLGLRLIVSGLLRFIQWERMENLSRFLQDYNMPSPLAVSITAMIVLVVSGISLMLGWQTWLFMFLLLAVVVGILVIIPRGQYFRAELPAIAIMIVSTLFIVLPVGKFTTGYMSRLKQVNKARKTRSDDVKYR
jgi:uncharacterized membrane protein YphA (DoxX/SURF4 family)